MKDYAVIAGRKYVLVPVETPDAHELLTVEETADMLGASKWQVYSWTRGENPKLPPVKLGRRTLRIRRKDVLAYLRSLKDGEG